MNTPLVSVLMTSYNREKYIGQAIESVLASTLKDFELIITDDCSKDKTVEIAQSYAAKDARVKVFINEKNLGDYPNRNKAASYAVGKYLKYVDADDCIYPWGLQLLVGMMNQFPEAGWGLCSLLQVQEHPYPVLVSVGDVFRYNYFKNSIFQKAPLSAIIKREVFEKENGFAPLRMLGDFEMWQRLALKYSVLLMPDGIVWYREHNEQEVVSYHKYVIDYEKVRLKYLNHVDNGLIAEEVRKIKKMMRYKSIRWMIENLVKFKKRPSISNFKVWWFYLNKF